MGGWTRHSPESPDLIKTIHLAGMHGILLTHDLEWSNGRTAQTHDSQIHDVIMVVDPGVIWTIDLA
jgi:hypothetical protein